MNYSLFFGDYHLFLNLGVSSLNIRHPWFMASPDTITSFRRVWLLTKLTNIISLLVCYSYGEIHGRMLKE